MDNSISIKGHVEQYLDGELISSKSNLIFGDLLEAFQVSMYSSINIGLGNDDASLFSNQNIQSTPDNIEIGNDGIGLRDLNASSDSPYFTMETTVENLNYDNYGVQWRGVQTASSERNVDQLIIGNGYLGGDHAGNIFNTTFALQTFYNNNFIISQGQTYEVFWGIHFQ